MTPYQANNELVVIQSERITELEAEIDKLREELRVDAEPVAWIGNTYEALLSHYPFEFGSPLYPESALMVAKLQGKIEALEEAAEYVLGNSDTTWAMYNEIRCMAQELREGSQPKP